MNVEVLADAEALAQAATAHFYATARDCVEKTGRFTVALTGGSTPERIYQMMAQHADRIDWSKVQIFWGDERCVPPDDPQSNYGMAKRTLLSRINIPDDNVHRMRGEIDPTKAAEEYERVIHDIVGESFDLIILGMGANAHIASLFPGSALLHETKRWVAAEYVEEVKMWRITLTPLVINKARSVVFWVAGAEKREAVQRVLNDPRDPDRVPAQIVAPQGELTWMLDSAAHKS